MTNPQGEFIFSHQGQIAVISNQLAGYCPRLANQQLAHSIGNTLALFHTQVTFLPMPQAGWMHPANQRKASPESQILKDAKLIISLLSGYESIRPLTKAEKRHLKEAVFHAANACISWFYAHGFDKYVPQHQSRAASFVSPYAY